MYMYPCNKLSLDSLRAINKTKVLYERDIGLCVHICKKKNVLLFCWSKDKKK